MDKVLKILNIVIRVVALIVITATAILSLSMAYIMFAPDEFPKPFRLVYQYAESVPGYMPSGVLPPVETEPLATVEPTEEPIHPGEGIMVDMSTKIINLSDPSGRKYIRLTVVLEFEPEAAAEGEEEAASGGHGGEEGDADPNAAFLEKVNARMPLMDDVVITLLSTKSYDALYTAEGKEALRTEIQNAINEKLPEFHVISVYFTEFVVQ